MKEREQILAAAKRLEPDPPRSKLDDYAEVIWELRRKRKRICTITAFLDQHGIRVGKSTVARWLKTHPVPKAVSANQSSRPLTPGPARRSAIEDASDDFFKPSNSKHEHHEQQEPKLWNRPD
jgi:hypothetical protein